MDQQTNQQKTPRTLMGMNVPNLTDQEYKSAKVSLICSYCTNDVKTIPAEIAKEIAQCGKQAVVFETQRNTLIESLRKLEGAMHDLQVRIQAMAHTASMLISPEEYEELNVKAEEIAMQEIAEKRKKIEEQQRQMQEMQRQNNPSEKRKVEGSNPAEDTPLDTEPNVIEGNFPKNGDSNENITMAGAAGKSGIKGVIKEIEDQNRSESIPEEKDSPVKE